MKIPATKVAHVVGARPNFIKIAPIVEEMARYPDRFEQVLVHTGQHYDDEMSQVFFDDLGIPRPDIDLGVGSGSHAEQTAKVMLAFEPVLLEQRPDLVLVVGDVNSTLACTLVASKLHVPVAHVEAGLRSFDRRMPEEINRVLTDQIADLLFTTERSANENLLHEGVDEDKIHFVGNVMIDTLLRHRERALALDTLAAYDLIEQGSQGAEGQRSGGAREWRRFYLCTSTPTHPCTICPVDAPPPLERGRSRGAERYPGRAGGDPVPFTDPLPRPSPHREADCGVWV